MEKLILLILLLMILGFVIYITIKISIDKANYISPTVPITPDNKACINTSTRKECGNECNTLKGCKTANPSCCFQLRPTGNNINRCYQTTSQCPDPSVRTAYEPYYSYGRTVKFGNIVTSPLNNSAMNVVAGTKNDDNFSPTFTGQYVDGTNLNLVDFDPSGGVSDGNTWGTPSNLAEIYYSMLVKNSPMSILDPSVKNQYLDRVLNWNVANQYKIAAPKCCNCDIFSQGQVYFGGFWRVPLGWGHFGEATGYTTFVSVSSDSFTSGKLKGKEVAIVCSQNCELSHKIILVGMVMAFIKSYNYNPHDDDLAKQMGNAIDSYFNSSMVQDPTTFANNVVYTMGLYTYDQNTQKETKVWASKCVLNNKIADCPRSLPNGLGVTTEPAYFFGSGSKPITSMMVLNAVYQHVWLKDPSIRQKFNNDFITWYCGGGYYSNGTEIPFGIGAVTMGDLKPYFNDNYYEGSTPGDVAWYSSEKTQYKSIKDWLFNVVYSDNACQFQTNPEYCPGPRTCIMDSVCDKSTCVTVPLQQYSSIFNNLVTPFDLSCHRGGIPDSDSIAGKDQVVLDIKAQQKARTRSIGSIEILLEVPGFHWVPGWTYTDKWVPITPSVLDPSMPPSSYSSSGTTLLGTLLWMLDPNVKGYKPWNDIDINSTWLPKGLQDKIHFSGTSGDGGKYMMKSGDVVG